MNGEREKRGEALYKIYRAFTYGLSPLIHLHLRWRKLRGLEHSLRWPERLGRPSLPRPAGPLVWFHAVSLGEGMTAIPVVRCCIQRRPGVTVLMTTTTTSAFDVIKNLLPSGVICQFAPIDTPSAMDSFFSYWKPNAIMLLESELWPNLIMIASKNGVQLVLLNARMSAKSFRNWSKVLQLSSLMLSKFSLILPLSNKQAIHFQLLQASPFIIKFSGDLKYAIEVYDNSKTSMDDLRAQLQNRRIWMASSIHNGEEEVMLGVHKMLKQTYPNLLTVIVPRHPQFGQDIARELKREGISVALRSRHDKIFPATEIYLADTLGELRDLYRLTPIAVIGGSFLPGLAGHNLSEAAAAGCAVLTGNHLGHFSSMALQMQLFNPLAVLKINDKIELARVLDELLCNAKLLEARRFAAKEAFHSLSQGIIENVWNLLDSHVYRKLTTESRAAW